jgi:hypothetical protein
MNASVRQPLTEESDTGFTKRDLVENLIFISLASFAKNVMDMEDSKEPKMTLEQIEKELSVLNRVIEEVRIDRNKEQTEEDVQEQIDYLTELKDNYDNIDEASDVVMKIAKRIGKAFIKQRRTKSKLNTKQLTTLKHNLKTIMDTELTRNGYSPLIMMLVCLGFLIGEESKLLSDDLKFLKEDVILCETSIEVNDFQAMKEGHIILENVIETILGKGGSLSCGTVQ